MKIIIANWKMNKTRSEAVAFVTEFLGRDAIHLPATLSLARRAGRVSTDKQIIIAPSFPLLAELAAYIKDTPLKLAAQNMHHESNGAFTGEVSAAQVADAGCGYVIIGHSERRQAGETDEMINQKMQRALEVGLTPILCVGETREQRDAGETQAVIEGQLTTVVGNADLRSLLIAYEPVWAIGGTTTPTLEEISSVHQFIKQTVGDHVPVLYGGSVTPDNSQTILNTPHVDGLLVGRASLNIDDFSKICYGE